MATLKDRLTIILSVLAFAISAYSFYVTTVRAVEPEIRAGSHFYIYHDIMGTAAFAMAINVTNTGARLAVVERLALLIKRPDSSSGYVLAPAGNVKVNDKGEPQEESIAGPIAVAGRSDITRQILFKASTDEDNFSITSSGKYDCTLVAWLPGKLSPMIADHFEIALTEIDAAQLANRLNLQVTNAVTVERLGGNEWRPGRVQDVDSLLKAVHP